MIEFDKEAFYEAAHHALPIDTEGFLSYVSSFENLILWGAGYLGQAVAEKLQDLDVEINTFWDLRATKLGEVNGLATEEPFSKEYDRENTLVIFCIASSFIRGSLMQDLKNQGYANMLMGQYVYEGLICPLDKYDSNVCKKSNACDSYTCLKNDNLFAKSLDIKPEFTEHEPMIFRNLTIVINQKCTLKCKFCYSYTNHYVDDKRLNFSLERILHDIDVFFDAVDGVKLIPLIGGEVFMHPDLNKIVKHILTKENFGLLNVTTNGICKMTEEDLDGFQNDRLQMVFSNYTDSVSEKQKELYYKNIEFAKSLGIQVIVPNNTPQWAMPTTLYDQEDDLDALKHKFKVCRGPFDCKYLKNGHFYPCSIVDPVHSLGIADYSHDYVALDTASSNLDLRRKIYDVEHRDHYKTCGHCSGPGGLTGVVSKAGEQGYQDFITKPELPKTETKISFMAKPERLLESN
jgi:organic radical activating enzyme